MNKLFITAVLAVLLMPAGRSLASDGLYGELMADAGQAEQVAPAGGNLDQKWERLSPEEKRRLLDMYERKQGRSERREGRGERREERRKAYEKMTPEERQDFRERMEKFRDMSPEDQDRMMRRMERIREMTPEEWKAYQEKVERFRSLPQEKRDEIRKRLDEIDKLPEAERNAERQKLKQELINEGIIKPGQGKGGGR